VHGHSAGDLVLQSVARTLSACVRPMDTLARYGGEEFAVVLPACQSAFWHVVAERIRRAVANTPIRISPSVEAECHREHWRRICAAMDPLYHPAVD
jgi:two-component system cell cycle response regulator